MNNLSLMIYAADASESLRDILKISSTVGMIALSTWGFFRIVSLGTIAEEKIKSPPAVAFGLVLAGFLLSAILPSSRTIYMIAASEAGHAVATSEQGQEILDAAREAILSKLKEAAQ